MLATILLLAQIVQSWPGLDSPLVQPGPTICVGECAGPVVWGPAERGRLVVACDMRSDTCSDGRKITTTRATPVPCEVAPGVWEMVPENTGCYGVRGLESWAQNTSYLSWGAELDRSPWVGAATVTLDGSTYRVCAESGGAFLQQLRAEDGGVVRTAACRVRAGTSNSIRLLAADVSSGGVNFDYTLTADWQTVTATATIREGGGVAGVRLHPARSGAGCVEVAGCWSVIGDTPGRACWGGEAPVTCAADQHTISTEGWPVVAGEVSFIYTPGAIDDETKYLVSASTFSSVGWEVYVRFGSPLAFLSHAGGSTRIIESDPLTWETRPYHIRVRWRAGEIVFWRDGVEVGRTSLSLVPAGPLPSTARIGFRGASGWVSGSISNLRIRSFE